MKKASAPVAMKSDSAAKSKAAASKAAAAKAKAKAAAAKAKAKSKPAPKAKAPAGKAKARGKSAAMETDEDEDDEDEEDEDYDPEEADDDNDVDADDDVEEDDEDDDEPVIKPKAKAAKAKAAKTKAKPKVAEEEEDHDDDYESPDDDDEDDDDEQADEDEDDEDEDDDSPAAKRRKQEVAEGKYRLREENLSRGPGLGDADDDFGDDDFDLHYDVDDVVGGATKAGIQAGHETGDDDTLKALIQQNELRAQVAIEDIGGEAVFEALKRPGLAKKDDAAREQDTEEQGSLNKALKYVFSYTDKGGTDAKQVWFWDEIRGMWKYRADQVSIAAANRPDAVNVKFIEGQHPDDYIAELEERAAARKRASDVRPPREPRGEREERRRKKKLQVAEGDDFGFADGAVVESRRQRREDRHEEERERDRYTPEEHNPIVDMVVRRDKAQEEFDEVVQELERQGGNPLPETLEKKEKLGKALQKAKNGCRFSDFINRDKFFITPQSIGSYPPWEYHVRNRTFNCPTDAILKRRNLLSVDDEPHNPLNRGHKHGKWPGAWRNQYTRTQAMLSLKFMNRAFSAGAGGSSSGGAGRPQQLPPTGHLQLGNGPSMEDDLLGDDGEAEAPRNKYDLEAEALWKMQGGDVSAVNFGFDDADQGTSVMNVDALGGISVNEFEM